MMNRVRRFGFSLFATLAILGFAAQTPAAAAAGERFEVTSLKAVRPILANTVAALQKHDAAGAKAAFAGYDSAWNGVEVYISTRNPDLYSAIEQNYQAKLTKELLDTPNPDAAAALPDAQAMLAKFDEAIAMVSKAAPLNPLYDDVARLRIVRAHLRDVSSALKAGDIVKARASFDDFDNKWDSIEDLIKDRSMDAYVGIEKGMIQIEKGLMPAKPDVSQVTALVTDISTQYNAVLADIAKDAKAANK